MTGADKSDRLCRKANNISGLVFFLLSYLVKGVDGCRKTTSELVDLISRGSYVRIARVEA